MKLKSIQYSESYEYQEWGLKRWNKMGIEAELDENEDPKEAHRTLRQLIDEIKAETLTQLEEQRGTSVREVKDEPVVDKVESWKQVISMCTSVKALERFKPQVDREKNEELTTAYNNKLKELQ
jgi:hypothetical protein